MYNRKKLLFIDGIIIPKFGKQDSLGLSEIPRFDNTAFDEQALSFHNPDE